MLIEVLSKNLTVQFETAAVSAHSHSVQVLAAFALEA
jgi:hypothetical protein